MFTPSLKAALGGLAIALAASGASAAPADTARAAAWFAAHTQQSPLARHFLQRMPKGADLHSHVSGAVYAESYLQWAAESDICVDTESLAFKAACKEESGKLVFVRRLLEPDLQPVYARLVDRMSMRNLAFAQRPGHDQFFDAFGTFPPVSGVPQRLSSMLAELSDRAALQNIQHLELMVTLQGSGVRKLGGELPWAQETDLARRHQWLLANGLPALVAAGREDLDKLQTTYRRDQRCDTATPAPGCAVSIGLLLQTTRTLPPEQVFAQMAYSFEMAKADKRVVGLNLVAPEDNPIALRDYSLQMQMLGFLLRHSPQVKISLHAGELALGLVAPEHLRSHIREAVTVAGARRIGHAVAIGHEDGALDTLKTMKARGVAAEICLTSNDVILGVRGRDHPLPVYLAAGVPVVLASDDEGISRIDLSNEYLRAAQDHKLGYRQLKQLSRNSLEYSFLAGDSLWRDPARARVHEACRRDVPGRTKVSGACSRFLAGSERATRQWALEAAFDAFEKLPEWRLPKR